MATLVRFWNDQSLKCSASSRWSSSLYCLMRNSNEMTFGMTHPALPVLVWTGVRLHKVLLQIFCIDGMVDCTARVIGKANNITIFWLCFNLGLPNGTKNSVRNDPKFSPFGPNQIKIRTCTVALFVLGTARKRI